MSRGICLVVEDDEDIADLMSFILRDEGFAVRAVPTASAALEEIRRGIPALITLDRGLPDADGLHLARELRKLTLVPLLMVTAQITHADELVGLASGAFAFLAKPFRSYELRDMVNELCSPGHGL